MYGEGDNSKEGNNRQIMELAKITMRAGKEYYIRGHTPQVLGEITKWIGWSKIEIVHLTNQEYETIPKVKLLENFKPYRAVSKNGSLITIKELLLKT